MEHCHLTPEHSKCVFIAFECMAKWTNIGYMHANSLHRVYQTHLLEQFIFVVVVFFSKCIKNNKWRYKRTNRIVTLEIKANDTLSRPYMYIYLESLIDFCVHSNKQMNERTKKKTVFEIPSLTYSWSYCDGRLEQKEKK